MIVLLYRVCVAGGVVFRLFSCFFWSCWSFWWGVCFWIWFCFFFFVWCFVSGEIQKVRETLS